MLSPSTAPTFSCWLAVAVMSAVFAVAGAVPAGAANRPPPTSSPKPTPTPTPAPTATPAPEASAMPSPSATATPRRLGFRAVTDASLTFVDTTTAGPGQVPPESAGFIAGSPLAPNTPYDLFSSAPEVPGVAGITQLVSQLSYGTPRFDIGAGIGFGYATGSVTNASYWGENLLPPLNPHLGFSALPYRIAFPTHAGQDDGSAARLTVLSGSAATADGNVRLRAGWLDLAQTDRFVFAPPALTSVNPAIAYAPAESLSSGLAGSDLWTPYATSLPLHGVDIEAKEGLASLELTNAALPSLDGESARLSMASLVIDHGEGTQVSAQILHAVTGGTPFSTTVPFGIDPQFTFYPQGLLPSSTLSGQRETIAGVRAAFHLAPALGIDGVAEIGRSWYDAAPVDLPGTEAPGGYYHVGVARAHGRTTLWLDAYRMEPRYATMILPYGVPENQWSAAFSWPGQWLKSNYQLIDNSVLGVNRQGYRVRYYVDGGPFEVHVEYTDLHQIEPETTLTSTLAGFVDGYYLPQLPNAATFGQQKRYGFWAAWHPPFGDLSLDVVDDTLFRPYAPGHLFDQVSYEVPQAVATYSRRLSPNVVFATGLGRYALKGAFSAPLDFAERLYFAGFEVKAGAYSTLVSFRRSIFGGITTFPASPLSPDFTGSQLIVEQRLHL
jgi:hypothetical protein